VIVIEAFLKYLERFLRASRSSCLAFLPTTRPRGSADYLFHCSHHRIHELSGMKEERKTVMFHRKRSKNDPLHCHQKKKTPNAGNVYSISFAVRHDETIRHLAATSDRNLIPASYPPTCSYLAHRSLPNPVSAAFLFIPLIHLAIIRPLTLPPVFFPSRSSALLISHSRR